MTDPARTLHVERTSEPTVLRWVCHRDDLDGTPVPPRESLLSTMTQTGVVDVLTITHGDLLLRFPNVEDLADGALLGGVHRAVGDALAMDGWAAPSGESAVRLRHRDDGTG